MICIDAITSDYFFVENVAKQVVLQHHPYATFEDEIVNCGTRNENIYVLLARLLGIGEAEARYIFNVEMWSTTQKAVYKADAVEGLKRVVKEVRPSLEHKLFP